MGGNRGISGDYHCGVLANLFLNSLLKLGEVRGSLRKVREAEEYGDEPGVRTSNQCCFNKVTLVVLAQHDLSQNIPLA